MIKSVRLLNESSENELGIVQNSPYELQIDLSPIRESFSSFTLRIEFEQPIIQFRNHDYR